MKNLRGAIVSDNGFWGIRYNKSDKITLINESNPNIIGYKISKFCKIHKYQYELENLYNRITLVNPFDDVDEDDIKKINNIIPDARGNSWGDALIKTRDDISLFADGLKYMANYNNLTQDSYAVEYGYIINVDTMKLEIWKGKQTIPQRGNRYGVKKNNGFYPCRMICQYSWNKIDDGLKNYKDIELIYRELQKQHKL